MSASIVAQSCSDEELAAQAVQRDAAGRPSEPARRACSELYDRHAPSLLAFLAARVARSQIDDVHQAVWQRVWEMLTKQRFAGHFRGWLFTVTRHYLIDLSRKKSPEAMPEGTDMTDTDQDSPPAQLIETERWQALSDCLEKLDRSAADLVRGRLGGEAYEVLCERLGLEPARAHRLFHSAKEQLQSCVQHAMA
jgi:RNA polymerase sigma factor (sigma-70 family)